MQNKCLRICLRVRLKHHVVDLHRDCDVDYLAIRYDLQLLLLIYKYMYGTMHNCENLGLKFQSAVPGGASDALHRYRLIGIPCLKHDGL